MYISASLRPFGYFLHGIAPIMDNFYLNTDLPDAFPRTIPHIMAFDHQSALRTKEVVALMYHAFTWHGYCLDYGTTLWVVCIAAVGRVPIKVLEV
jgi:hypothetical protein